MAKKGKKKQTKNGKMKRLPSQTGWTTFMVPLPNVSVANNAPIFSKCRPETQ